MLPPAHRACARCRHRRRRGRPSSAKDSEVEAADALGIGEDVDLGDLAAGDGEAEDRERAPLTTADGARGAVDEGGLYVQVELGEGDRLSDDRLRAVDLLRPSGGQRTEVGSEDDVRAEDRDQRFELPLPGGGEESTHDFTLCGQIGIGG